ncbi:MAG: tetratricopeptide repeat protein [Calditrichia bacterium]
MTITCKKCSNSMEQADKFCGACGAPKEKNVAPLLGTKVDMQLSDIRYNLAQVYVKKGDFQKALNVFEKLLEENPDNSEIQLQINSLKSMLEVSS